MLTVVLAVLFLALPSFRAFASVTLPATKAKHGWQWRWDVWLPDKWARVSRCETGLNFRFHNSSYVSAFGISRRAYDEDARVMGAPRWDDNHIPSPWFQYRAALGHYRLHGGFDGWGCRNA